MPSEVDDTTQAAEAARVAADARVAEAAKAPKVVLAVEAVNVARADVPLGEQEDVGPLGVATGSASVAASGSCHIWVAGEEAPFDEARERTAGKRGFGHATRSNLPYYAN